MMGSELNNSSELMKIFEAASGNHVRVLKQALNGEYGEILNEDLELALLRAAKNGHCECVVILLENKVNIEAKDGLHNTPLILTSEGGHTDVVRVLLKNGCNVSERNSLGYNALMRACEHGYVDVAEILIKSGADDDNKVENEELNGNTGTLTQSQIAARQLTPLLITIVKQPPCYVDLIKLLLQRKSSVFDKNAEQCTALHFAAKTCDVSVVEMLINAGSDVNAKDFWGATPLMNAASYNRCDTAKLLLESGANVDVTDAMLRSPLSIAARNDGTQLVEMLISSGANVDHLDAHRNPPLFISIGHKNYAAAKCLIKHGCNIRLSGRHMSTRRLMTFLQLAVWCKDTQMIEILYRAGAFSSKDLYNIFNDSTYSNHCEDEPYVWEYLDWLVRKPRPLVSSCRLVILASCKHKLLDSLEKLNLPSSLKEYLKFSDIVL